MKVISHDAFARTEIVRTKIDLSSTSLYACTTCGNVPCNKSGKHYLFKYGIRKDDSLIGYVDWYPRLFCSIGCYRAYTN
jgi:hypothetical protein